MTEFLCNRLEKSCRRLLRFSRRLSCGFMLSLFLARAAQSGDLWRWGELAARLADEPFWLSATFLAVAAALVPVPRFVWLAALAGISLLHDVQLEPELFFGGLAWSTQLLQLMVELIFSTKDFFFCALMSAAGLFGRLLGGPPLELKLVELTAGAVVQLWLLRAAYKHVAFRLERWRARDRLNWDVRCALARPFRAAMKLDFSREVPTASQQRPQGSKGLIRSFSFTFIHSGDISSDQLDHLRAKHAALLQARRALHEDQIEYTDMLTDCLCLEIRREYVLEDSLKALQEIPTCELLAPYLEVKYAGEEGVDYGGLAVDWFDALGQALVKGADNDQSSSPLALGKSSRMLIPRPSHGLDSESAERHFRELLLVGRFLALGVIHGGRPLPLPLSPLVCKYIVGMPVDLDDVKRLDPDFHRERLVPLLCEGGLAAFESALGEPLTFVSVPTQLRPEPEELQPGGSTTVVTEENLPQYLELLCEAFLCSEIRHELQCLLRGFWDVLPLDAIREAGLNAWDLVVLISGTRRLDLEAWQHHSSQEAEGEEAEAVLCWFWLVLQEMSEEQRRQLLHFVTGSGRLPAGGFAMLRPPFTVAVSEAGSLEHLPHANTCVNRLVLHKYQSMDQLRIKLTQALPTNDFGFS
eukprot:TRINITY_DN95049_c0_g1_i1.p1 TRINITY_DN95049_c0_g1~~TRINITY_DN95049_c0_g1_i1.p1  ORF type:complete len:640 (+),score=143.20 TRINITY_DN95049_c0_g1_i1:37-1956(+)